MQCVFCLKSSETGVLFHFSRTICRSCARRLDHSKSLFSRTFYHRFVGQLYASYSLTSIYRYDGLMRDLFWAVKVRMDGHCVKLLMGLFLLNEEIWLQAIKADLIMVAPSSLWSRLRGRVDLAYLLAAKLATMTSKPLVYSPPSCYWRFRKRARVKHHQGRDKSATGRFFGTLYLKARIAFIRWSPLPCLYDFRDYVDVVWFRKNQIHQYKNLLLIDDVVTTGETIRAAIMKMQLARKKFYLANHMSEEEIQIRCLTLAHGNM